MNDAVLFFKLLADAHVLSVPDVMSSVTRMMHLWPFTVDFQESWKRTMLGCCRHFSISTSSLKRCRSALVSLRVCREKSEKRGQPRHPEFQTPPQRQEKPFDWLHLSPCFLISGPHRC